MTKKWVIMALMLTAAVAGCRREEAGAGNGPGTGGGSGSGSEGTEQQDSTATPEPEDSVFTEITRYGVYDLHEKIIKEYLKYTEGTDQISNGKTDSTESFSIVNLKKGYVLKISTGGSLSDTLGCQLSLTSIGVSCPDGTYNTTLVKQDSMRLWLQDTLKNTGFVIRCR